MRLWQCNPEALETQGQSPETVATLRRAVVTMSLWELVGMRPEAPRAERTWRLTLTHRATKHAGSACTPHAPRTAFEQAVRASKSFVIALALVKRGTTVNVAADGMPF